MSVVIVCCRRLYSVLLVVDKGSPCVTCHQKDVKKMDLETLSRSVKEMVAKMEEQSEVISLLQVEVEFQNDRISVQDKIIGELTAKLTALTKKVSEHESAAKASPKVPTEVSSKDEEDIWKGTSNLSIADQAKEIAEKTLMTNLGYVFDPNTKLYCNYSTGYYYDPNQELYYNGHTGTYYTLDESSQEYKFHSQIEVPRATQLGDGDKCKERLHSSRKRSVKESSGSQAVNRRRASNEGEMERKKALKVRRPISVSVSNVQSKNESEKDSVTEKYVEEGEEDPEEGELSESSASELDEKCESDQSVDANGESDTNCEMESNEKYPPCIRAIITESASDEIKTGSLYLVTCMGGTIGREGYEHAIMLPQPLVEKTHAKIQYIRDPCVDESEEKYFISDLGSRSGTFLNGKRLSNEKEKSDPHEILHGSLLKIGGFTILMHIHPGSFTCGHCEPGLLMKENDTPNKSSGGLVPESTSRQAMMRQIKKKYGIQRPQKSGELPDAENYKDRAQERRVVKGSDNPFEKTQVATLEAPISETNKGFAMLKKMGWSKGKGLGQSTHGLVEPISLEPKNNRGGLGLESDLTISTPAQLSSAQERHGNNHSRNHRVKKSDRLAITVRRFKEAEQQPEHPD